MARKVIFAPDEFYHLYNRGVDKRLIFNTNKDRGRFVKLLYLCNGKQSFHFSDLARGDIFLFDRGETLVDIIAYCLMDNHFHLLVKEKSDTGISIFMHKLATSYTMYFNKINERKGRLFENNFQARLADSNEYLKYLNAYIHLNPIKIIEPEWKERGIKNLTESKQFLEKYHYSSLLDYLGQERPEKIILNQASNPHFENKGEISAYLQDWLEYNHHEA